jgi:dihydrofolate reductase
MEKNLNNVNAILAHDDNYGIGKNNDLPWPRNDADLKWFRECTIGHVVVMGRKTWESIGSKPLPKRINVVVSTQQFPDQKDGGPDHVLFGNVQQGIQTLLTELYPNLKIWIIGGADLYSQTLSQCDNIYLTHIPGDYNCDNFVELNQHLVGYTEMAKKEQDGLTFSIWRKI